MKTRKAFSFVSVIAVMAMASVLVVGTASAAGGTASIVVQAQDCCNSGVVVVDSAMAPQDGWLGIFRRSDGALSSLVGFVPVVKGQNGQLMVNVESKQIGSAPMLWAGFIVDPTGLGTTRPNFLFNLNNLALAPNSPLVGFATQKAAAAAAPAVSQPAPAPVAAAPAASQPAPAPVAKGPVTNKISIKSQDCCDSGVVVVDSAMAPQDGWLGIFRSSDGALSSLVGFVPVVKGQNGPLTVSVEGNRIGSAPTLWAGFIVDPTGLGTTLPNFLFNLNNLALAPNSPLVAFGTSK